ncbi:hypothetical protein KHA92_20300, partial [Klebsiella pneumoniae]
MSFLSWLRNENEQKRGLFILWRFILPLLVRKSLHKEARYLIQEAKASEELKTTFCNLPEPSSSNAHDCQEPLCFKQSENDSNSCEFMIKYHKHQY